MTNVRQIIINSSKYGQKICLVDEEDFEYLSQFKWYLLKNINAKTFYATAWIGKKTVKMHRVIMRARSGVLVDHVDYNGLNNQKYNLRFCNHSQNVMNTPKNNSTGFRGVVRKCQNCYCARVVINKKRVIIGHYKTAQEAAIKYNEAAIKHYGSFAILNVL